MSLIVNEQWMREVNERNRDEGGFVVYMFEEDRKMIEGLFCECSSGKINGEGVLFGLWIMYRQLVLYIVFKLIEKVKEKGMKSLFKEYFFLQDIGRYVLFDYFLENVNEVIL